MATVTRLPDVREALEEQHRGTWDAIAEPGELTLVQGRVVSPRLYRYEYPTGLTPSPWATGQMCQLLGIPTAYFRRCPVELQGAQFNYWQRYLHTERQRERAENRGGFRRRAERWLIRARQEVLRGVLTERYVRLDNLDLFAALSPALSEQYEVDWFSLSDESFHLRLHDARLFRDALPGDRLMAGVHIANSEVGKRAVTVDALVYRVVCANGLIRKVTGQSLLHQRHIALSKPEFSLTIRQAVRAAFAESALAIERLSSAVAHPIEDVEKTVRKLALDWGLTQATEEAVKATILLEHPSQHETLYGLLAGLTGAARDLGADERYTLEAQAGSFLERHLKEDIGGAKLPPLSLSGRIGSATPRDTSKESANGTMALFTVP